MLEFYLAAAPELFWNDLEAFVARRNPRDSAMLARLNLPRGQKQAQVPLTLRLDGRGGVRADTTLTVAGRAIRVLLERVDTLSVMRPW